MSHKHPYGPVIPDAGDDLLKSWEMFVRTGTNVISVQSVDEIKALLASLSASGISPTPKHPLYFDIQGVFYRSDGYYPNTGDFTLFPVNGSEAFTVTAKSQAYNFGRAPGSYETISLAAGRWHRLMHVASPVRKYAQSYLVIGTCWTSAQTGNMNLELYERPTDGAERGSKTRILTGDDSSTQVIKSGYIAAGEQMDFTLYLRAETYNSAKVTVYYDDWTRLYVQLTPAAL